MKNFLMNFSCFMFLSCLGVLNSDGSTINSFDNDYSHEQGDEPPVSDLIMNGCKRPKQGPPGPPAPPLGNYIDSFRFGAPQPVTIANVPIPIIFNFTQLSNGWVVTNGTDFTNTQSGLYLITFGAGIFSGSVFNSNSILTCFVNGFEYNPAHIYQEYSVYSVSQMTTSCILSYNAGDVIQFTFQCSDTSMSLFGNAFVTIVRIQ